LPAIDGAATKDTDPLVVERMPAPARIVGLENPEAFFWEDVKTHIRRAYSTAGPRLLESALWLTPA
jgi:hypothetical protein